MHSPIRSLRFVFQQAEGTTLKDILWAPVISWYLSETKQPRTAREVFPLPLHFESALEKNMLNPNWPESDKLIAGSFLFQIWSGLKYQDMQWVQPKSLTLQEGIVRCVSTLTKSRSPQPAANVEERLRHLPSLPSRIWWRWCRKNPAKRSASPMATSKKALKSDMMADATHASSSKDLIPRQACLQMERFPTQTLVQLIVSLGLTRSFHLPRTGPHTRILPDCASLRQIKIVHRTVKFWSRSITNGKDRKSSDPPVVCQTKAWSGRHEGGRNRRTAEHMKGSLPWAKSYTRVAQHAQACCLEHSCLGRCVYPQFVMHAWPTAVDVNVPGARHGSFGATLSSTSGLRIFSVELWTACIKPDSTDLD